MAVNGGFHDCGLIASRWNTYSEVGDRVEAHLHNNPHHMICKAGKVRVGWRLPGEEEKDTRWAEQGPYDFGINVPKNVVHIIECIQAPARTECLFLHRTPEGEITDRFSGDRNAYE